MTDQDKRLELERPQRSVEYFGLSIFVPIETEYLSTDPDGCVMAHSLEPWKEPDFYEGHELGYVAKVVVTDGFDWRKSLVKYDNEEL